MEKRGVTEVIDFVEQMSDDKHICLIYEEEAELTEILVPYFEKGLEKNEGCVWVLSGDTQKSDVVKALKNRIPEVNEFLEKQQMILLYSKDLYEKDNKFDSEMIMGFWADKEKQAIDAGLEGLRVSGSPKGEQWGEMVKYEEILDDKIQDKPVKAICTYSAKRAGLPEILSVGVHHSKVVVCQKGTWKIIDSDDPEKLLEALGKPYFND